MGVQEPSLYLPPAGVVDNVAPLAESIFAPAGLVLDPWQRTGLEAMCARRRDGLWAAPEVAIVVSRRNGKLGIVIVRCGGGLFVFDDMEIRYTAHRDDTALDALTKMWAWIKASPELYDLCNGEEGLKKSHQEKSITVAATGAKMFFSTRSEGGGRGLDGDVVVLDEALDLSAELLADRLPAILARRNPQVIYLSSYGKATSRVLHDLLRRAVEGDNDGFALCGWSAADLKIVDGRMVSTIEPDERKALARANPALGYRLTEEKLNIVKRGMRLTPQKFVRECLGVSDPLPEDTDARPVKLPFNKWRDTGIDSDDAVERWPSSSARALAFDVDRDGRSASIALGSGSLAGVSYGEVIDFRKGAGWLPATVVQWMIDRPDLAVGCNNSGPTGAQVGAVLELMAEAGIPKERLTLLGAGEFKQACGSFFTAVEEGRFERPADNQADLDRAAADATERALQGGFAWAQRNVTVPLSPLNAVTVARALLPIEAVEDEEALPLVASTR